MSESVAAFGMADLCSPSRAVSSDVKQHCIGRTKGGLNSKLHVVCNGAGKPLVMMLTECQMSDHKGARLMLGALPPAAALIGGRGYDSNWFRQAPKQRGTEPCIPPTKSRKTPLDYDKALYRTANATKSRICSPNSRTGGISPQDTIDAPTPSSRPSVSQQPSPSISIDES